MNETKTGWITFPMKESSVLQSEVQNGNFVKELIVGQFQLNAKAFCQKTSTMKAFLQISPTWEMDKKPAQTQ